MHGPMHESIHFLWNITPCLDISTNVVMQPARLKSGPEHLSFMTDLQPDLSHLTAEERRIIEDVMSRQHQEAIQDEHTLRYVLTFHGCFVNLLSVLQESFLCFKCFRLFVSYLSNK